MSILEILTLALVSLFIGSVTPSKIRSHLLLAASIIFVYWIQSRTTTINNITFWLPTATIILVTVSWVLTSLPETRTLQKNWPGILITIITILGIDLTRYFGETNPFFSNIATPRPIFVILVISIISLSLFMAQRISAFRQIALASFLLFILLIFIVIKTPALNSYLYTSVSEYTGSLPKNNEFFVWLGFSYFGFRMIHTIRDRQNGLLPPVTFTEYMNYTIFFPAFAAGPIDRVERFIVDLNKSESLANLNWLDAGNRFVVGLFKKFVVADTLATFALNSNNAMHVSSSGWFWVLLYTYAFQIYFDFSGYTDIAIGLGKIMRINLPENFNSPYLKPNLTLFWNSWHMTLTQWFRSYFFNPFQRGLRSSRFRMASLAYDLNITGLHHGADRIMAWSCT